MADSLSDMIFAPTDGQSNYIAPYTVAAPASLSPYVALKRIGILVSLGTVTLIQYTRLGVSLSLPTVAGLYELNAGDSLTFTYTVAPTLTIIER